MKALFKILAICSIFFIQAYSLDINKGWNYMGISSNMLIKDIKKQYPKIDKIFRLNSGTYEDITNKDDLTIYPNYGLLVRSSGNFKIYFNNRATMTSGKIFINQGWNLRAISADISLFAKIFDTKGVKIWTYEPVSKKWFSYKTGTNKNQIIKSMQGFLIYSPVSKTYDLQKLSVNLTTFNNKQSIYDFLEKMVILHKAFRENYNNLKVPEGLVASPMPSSMAKKVSSDGVQDATNTNVQEIGVDEADIIKHNGKNIFYILYNTLYSSSFDSAIQERGNGRKIDIFKDYTNINIQSLYLNDNKLIVLANKGSAQIYRSIRPYPQSKNEVYVQIYDVSDIDNIYLIKDIKIDGSLVDSRLANNKLYLVSRFSPYFQIEQQRKSVPCSYIKNTSIDILGGRTVLPLLPVPSSLGSSQPTQCFSYDKSITSKHIRPTINVDGISSDLLEPKNFFALMSAKSFLDITTTTSFDLDNLDKLDKLSVMLPVETVYMSPKSLYLASSHYGTANRGNFDDVKTLVYKISLKNKLSFIDHIFVEGRVLNQFSLSEYNDVLRIATTWGSSFRNNTDNMVTTIKEDNAQLEQIGYLNNLGKTGETIKSVRFMKDKAFLVTFKRTDPFYTIDLSIPENPQKAGELHIPGFSTYLHDVGGGKILALGNNADKDGRVIGIQVQLFDVSDFNRPTLLDKYIFDKTSYSNSLYEHKAFTYRQSDSKFAMSVNSHKDNFYGFYVFKIQDKEIKKVAIVESDNYSYGGRSIIFTKENKDYILMLGRILTTKEIK